MANLRQAALGGLVATGMVVLAGCTTSKQIEELPSFLTDAEIKTHCGDRVCIGKLLKRWQEAHAPNSSPDKHWMEFVSRATNEDAVNKELSTDEIVQLDWLFPWYPAIRAAANEAMAAKDGCYRKDGELDELAKRLPDASGDRWIAAQDTLRSLQPTCIRNLPPTPAAKPVPAGHPAPKSKPKIQFDGGVNVPPEGSTSHIEISKGDNHD